MKYFSLLLAMVAMSMCMVSCGDDDSAASDYAAQVAGVYTGQLTTNGTVVEDAYVVNVAKISSTVVQVSANFFSTGSENYNVSYVNGQYEFTSESSVNITIRVNGKTMNISYLTNGGYIMNFTGTRD